MNITIDPIINISIIIAIALILFVVTVYTYLSVSKHLTISKRLFLLSLRIVGLAALIAILLQPSIEIRKNRTPKEQVLIVAVDSSKSMLQKDAEPVA